MEVNCNYCSKKVLCKSINDCVFTPMLEEIEEMQSFLEITPSDDPKELIQRLTDINVYLARSGKLLSDAKAYQDEAIANVYAMHSDFVAKVPAAIALKFVSSQCAVTNQLVNWLDRINRTLVHSGDNIRTQISFAKQDLALQRKGY